MLLTACYLCDLLVFFRYSSGLLPHCCGTERCRRDPKKLRTYTFCAGGNSSCTCIVFICSVSEFNTDSVHLQQKELVSSVSSMLVIIAERSQFNGDIPTFTDGTFVHTRSPCLKNWSTSRARPTRFKIGGIASAQRLCSLMIQYWHR